MQICSGRGRCVLCVHKESVYCLLAMKYPFNVLTTILLLLFIANLSRWSPMDIAEPSSMRGRPAPSSSLNPQLMPFSRMPKDFAEALEWIAAARQGKPATLVQIGANDGQLYDPFFAIYNGRMEEWHRDWMALLVEPQPDLYSKVAVFHSTAQDWAFYHGAVASPAVCINGTIEFCETRTPGVGDWRTQGQINTIVAARCTPGNENMHLQKRPCVTSIDKLLEHASPNFRAHTLDVKPPSSSTPRYNLDFLQIDVEGVDFQLLQLIDWDVIRPQCLQYEQQHLGDNKPVARAFVEAKGYATVESANTMDVLACRVAAT